MRLVVGLGNPGREHDGTRHNAGFRWVDGLAALGQVQLRQEARFHGQAAKLAEASEALRTHVEALLQAGPTGAADAPYFTMLGAGA